MEENQSKLIFVYNADSGLINGIVDTGHKLISPNTYKCNLCKLAFGVVGYKKQWKQFLDQLGAPFVFLHKDEFIKKYQLNNALFPAVFSFDQNGISQLVSSDELNAAKDLDQLIAVVKNKLSTQTK